MKRPSPDLIGTWLRKQMVTDAEPVGASTAAVRSVGWLADRAPVTFPSCVVIQQNQEPADPRNRVLQGTGAPKEPGTQHLPAKTVAAWSAPARPIGSERCPSRRIQEVSHHRARRPRGICVSLSHLRGRRRMLAAASTRRGNGYLISMPLVRTMTLSRATRRTR